MSKTSVSNRIIINTITQILSKVFAVGLSIISVALLARYLGAEKYGWFTLVFTYVSFFTTLADVGYNQTIVRELSLDIKRSHEAYATFFNIKILLIAISIIAALVGLGFTPYESDLKIAIIIGIAALTISNLSSYGTSILQSKLRLDLVSLLDLLTKGVTVICIYFFIRYDLGFYSIIYAVLIGNVVGMIVEYFFVRDWIVLSLHFDKKIANSILKISFPVGITAVLTMVYFKVDTLMLSMIRTPVEVGIYALAYKVLDNIIMLWGLIMASIFPLLSKYHGNADNISYRRLVKNTTLIAIGLSCLVILIGNTSAPLIMRILGGSKFYSSIEPFKILLYAVPFLFINNIFFNIILSFGKTNYLIIPLLSSLALTIILNAFIIPLHGYIGASYVTVVTELITSSVYLYILFSRFKEQKVYLS